jgi:polyhydroxyalkanoate synthesis regulator phasin
MLNDIRQLIGCGDQEVEQQAQVVLELSDSLAKGELTEAEYRELLEDIANTFDIEELAGDMKFKATLVTAVYGILQVV